MTTKGAAYTKDDNGKSLPINVFVGTKIRVARKTADDGRGLSQQKLASKISGGISFQQVQKYENGTNRVSVPTLIEIANITGRPFAWFLDGAPGMNGAAADAGDPVTRLAATRGGIDLAVAFLAIDSAAVRAALVDMAQSMAENLGGDAS